MRLRTIIIPVILALAVFPVHGDVIYKWKSKTGETQYGQFPPAGVSAERISTGFTRSVPRAEPEEDAAPAVPAPAGDLQKPVEQVGQADAAEPAPLDEAQVQADREQKCANARSDLETLQQGGHRRMRLPDGTVTHLTAEQTAERIAATKQHIETYCD